jgi:hypothetical protein
MSAGLWHSQHHFAGNCPVQANLPQHHNFECLCLYWPIQRINVGVHLVVAIASKTQMTLWLQLEGMIGCDGGQ